MKHLNIIAIPLTLLFLLSCSSKKKESDNQTNNVPIIEHYPEDYTEEDEVDERFWIEDIEHSRLTYQSERARVQDSNTRWEIDTHPGAKLFMQNPDSSIFKSLVIEGKSVTGKGSRYEGWENRIDYIVNNVVTVKAFDAWHHYGVYSSIYDEVREDLLERPEELEAAKVTFGLFEVLVRNRSEIDYYQFYLNNRQLLKLILPQYIYYKVYQHDVIRKIRAYELMRDHQYIVLSRMDRSRLLEDAWKRDWEEAYENGEDYDYESSNYYEEDYKELTAIFDNVIEDAQRASNDGTYNEDGTRSLSYKWLTDKAPYMESAEDKRYELEVEAQFWLRRYFEGCAESAYKTLKEVHKDFAKEDEN